MFAGDLEHYLSCGASALDVVTGVLALAGSAAPARILDFGAGCGRVTRWLQAAFPSSAIEACDVREADVAFCRERLGIDAWASRTKIDALSAPGTYDLIWAGSVLTHLDADGSVRLLRRLLDWATPDGLVVVTLHGRTAVEFGASGRVRYNEPDRWAHVVDGYRASGYGYADYLGWPGYGVSLTSLAWTARLVESWSDVRLVALSERAWDGHQDVLALQRLR